VTARPLIETPVPKADITRGDGKSVCTFVETFCRLTKDGVAARAGTLIELRPWMTDLYGKVYARRPDGRYRAREALIGLPRKNSKSANGSSMGLYGLLFSGEGAEVYSCAADKEQARIVFGVAKRMVEMDPMLSDQITCYRDALSVEATGSVYKVLSSEAFSKEGLNPSVVVYDELHAAPNPELYSVMSLGSGTRRDPLLIAITTAGTKYDITGQESVCYQRYQYGCKVATGEVVDPYFYMCWYGAPPRANYKDPAVWEEANPGYGDFLDPDDFRAALGRVTENDFRTKRLNQWVSSVQAWLPDGAWAACRTDADLAEPGRGVVLGFDGSKSGDSTALVAVSVSPDPFVRVLGLWENPGNVPEWRVPRPEVKDAIRQACRDYRVREVAWDEFQWLDAAEELEAEGIPVVVFPQTLTRMGPATQRFYEAVTNRRLRHNGDPRMARHLENAQLKVDSRGSRLQKDARNSPNKIDLAVSAVMALDRADFYLNEPGQDDWVASDGTVHRIEDIGFVW
jgi:phage terminase large subunit-like protein